MFGIILVLLLILTFLIICIPYEWFSSEQHPQIKLKFTLRDYCIGQFVIKRNRMNGNIKINQEIVKENLLVLNSILKKYNIDFWLSEGTALGAVRDNSIIPWDDDLDISFYYSEYYRFIKLALPDLLNNDFILSTVGQQGTFIAFIRKGEKIDVDIVKPDGKCIANRTKNTNYSTDCNELIKYLGNMRNIEFLGTTFKVPGDDYFEYLYSSTWKTPSKSK